MEYTLATLKAAIIAWLEDDGAEFQASLDQMIQLAEQQILKDLPFSIFDEIATGTLTSATLTKPAGWVSTINLFVTDAGAQKIVQPKPWDYVHAFGGTGVPIYYAETSETTITVAPTPTSSPYTLRYIQRPTSLVDTADPGTTWMSANVPEVLFWGSIMQAEHFRKADNRIEVARAYYERAVTTARQELRHLIRKEYN